MTLQRDPTAAPVRLTDDEIRTAMLLSDAYIKAVAQAEQARRLQEQYMEQLRSQYGLGQEWTCLSTLEGFVRYLEVEVKNG